jgi:hypothetical protein
MRRQELYDAIWEVLNGECGARCMDDDDDLHETTLAMVRTFEELLAKMGEQ